MSKGKRYTKEFKIEAVKQVTDCMFRSKPATRFGLIRPLISV
jgi:transposase-like protein